MAKVCRVPLADVVRNPDQYDLTPAQRSFVDEAVARLGPRGLPDLSDDLPVISGGAGPTTIKTAREVEAASKRVPPAERAALAAEPPDVRVPIEDWDTVAVRMGERYQQNWFTKLDDMTAGARGVVQRPFQKAVRNLMVTRDQYIWTQGGRMQLGLYDWIGRNRKTLGLVTTDPRIPFRGASNRGKALAVQLAPGAKVDPRLAQRLDHIVTHPEKYTITPEQQTALKEADDMFTNLLRAEQSADVDINELAEAYWTRIVTKTPKGENVEQASKSLNRRMLGGKPFYAKERAIPDLEQLYAAGYQTADPLTAFEKRLTLAPESIANRRVLNELKGMGYKPSEKVPESARTALREATEEYRAVRARELKAPNTTAGRAELLEAEVKLDQAKRAMRHEANLAVQRSPKIAGRVVSQDVFDEVARYIDQTPESALDDFFRTVRSYRVGADAGSALIQNWNTFWRNNPAWLKAIALGGRGVADAPYDYIVKNLDQLERGVRYGAIVAPEEFLLNQGGRLSQRVGRAPLLKEAQRFFEWNIFAAQGERWKAVERLAKNEDELLDLATVLRHESGSTWMPGMTVSQARTMTRMWFAPKYVAAMHNALLDPVLKSGPARREAIKALGMAFGGAAMATVAINVKFNGELPNMTDPDKPGFWGVRFGDSHIYPFGPYQPFLVVMARSARAADDLANGRTPSARDLQAWPRFVESKASIPARLMVRVAEAMGLPLENIRGPSFGQPEFIAEDESAVDALKRTAFEEFSPIGLSGALGAGKAIGVNEDRGILQGEYAPGLEAAGGRTTTMSSWQLFKEAFREIKGRDYKGSANDRAIAEQDPALAAMLGKADASFGADRERRNEQLAAYEQEQGIPQIAADVQAGKADAPEQFRNAIGEERDFYAALVADDLWGVEFPEPTDERSKLYRAYADLQRGDFTGDDAEGEYRAAKDAAFDALPADLKSAMQLTRRSQDPAVRALEAQLNKDRRAIEAQSFDVDGLPGRVTYWDVRDAMFEAVRSDAEAAGFRSLTELDAQQNVAGPEADQARRVLSHIDSWTTKFRERMRSQSADLDARLSYWYGVTLLDEDDSWDAHRRLYPSAPMPRQRVTR